MSPASAAAPASVILQFVGEHDDGEFGGSWLPHCPGANMADCRWAWKPPCDAFPTCYVEAEAAHAWPVANWEIQIQTGTGSQRCVLAVQDWHRHPMCTCVSRLPRCLPISRNLAHAVDALADRVCSLDDTECKNGGTCKNGMGGDDTDTCTCAAGTGWSGTDCGTCPSTWSADCATPGACN